MKADVSERQRVKLLADMIGYYRLCCPRIGGFKLFHLLEKDLGHAVTLGRDSFLKVYESKGFKLNPNKRRRTTDSNHVYKRYRCFQWLKVTKMKANHNCNRIEPKRREAVSNGPKLLK